MANPEHLKILKGGVEAWNAWRRAPPEIRLETQPGGEHLFTVETVEPDLRGAVLRGADLRGFNFRGVNLTNADLSGADMSGADLRGTFLMSADLRRGIFRAADLSGAHMSKADIRGAKLPIADISGADLTGANLTGADAGSAKLIDASLAGANLGGASLLRANLGGANLRNASLLGAGLRGAILRRAILCGADLSSANLTDADLSSADLSDANVERATVGGTIFGSIDLREVRGLGSLNHWKPSEVSVSTIYRSKGQIPEAFLRGCGVPESFIVQIHALVTAMQPVEFYSCFISYSSTDQEFAERLHADLQAKGVRVWFAPHDLPIGARIRPAIDNSIRLHDKLLLVLSEASVSSQWVEQEVETALAREREQEGKIVLFPIRIDNALMKSRVGWPALLRNTRNVGDFTRWKDHDSYWKSFERLLRDLKAGA